MAFAPVNAQSFFERDYSVAMFFFFWCPIFFYFFYFISGVLSSSGYSSKWEKETFNFYSSFFFSLLFILFYFYISILKRSIRWTLGLSVYCNLWNLLLILSRNNFKFIFPIVLFYIYYIYFLLQIHWSFPWFWNKVLNFEYSEHLSICLCISSMNNTRLQTLNLNRNCNMANSKASSFSMEQQSHWTLYVKIIFSI